MGIINSVDFLDVRVDDFDYYGVACACTTRLAIQGSCTCMPYESVYFMHHFQRSLTADIETLARTMSVIVEGRLLYSHDRTVLRQDKQLRDNELMVDQSNLTWNTYVQYNQCSFHYHYWVHKEKVMEIAIFLGIPYHLLASLVPVH